MSLSVGQSSCLPAKIKTIKRLFYVELWNLTLKFILRPGRMVYSFSFHILNVSNESAIIWHCGHLALGKFLNIVLCSHIMVHFDYLETKSIIQGFLQKFMIPSYLRHFEGLSFNLAFLDFRLRRIYPAKVINVGSVLLVLWIVIVFPMHISNIFMWNFSGYPDFIKMLWRSVVKVTKILVRPNLTFHLLGFPFYITFFRVIIKDIQISEWSNYKLWYFQMFKPK